MSLAISKTSWHYRLHLKVRKAWGWKPSPKERWSLCPYFHATVWGTLLTVGVFPIAVIGWLFCKFVRNTYKYSSKVPVLNFIPKAIDNTQFVSAIDDAPDDFDEAPVLAGLMWAFFLLVSSLIVAVVAFLSYLIAAYGIGFVFGLIPQIPGALWATLLFVGDIAFWIMAFIGYCLTGLAAVISDVAYVSWHWIAGIFSSIVEHFSSAENWISFGKIAVMLIGGIAGVWAIAALGIFAASSKKAIEIYEWFSIKANGYMEARDQRQREAREKEKKDRLEKEAAIQSCIDALDEMDKPKPKKVKEHTYKKPPKPLGQSVRESSEKVFTAIKSLYAKEINIEYTSDKYGRSVRTSTKVLGPIGVVAMFLWSLKKGVCPLLDFVENDEDDETSEKEESCQ